jgi:purine-nucleoside phosphorylase
MSFHIGAKKDEIAEIVLLSGDPLRAKHIAENYLDNVHEYNKVRNMLGFTGYFQGTKVSVQGSGMGLPSTAIYTHELIHEYSVKTLIRLGTAGSLQPDVEVGDIILAMSASTDSNMNQMLFQGRDYAPTADFGLLQATYETSKRLNIPVKVGGILSTDTFYSDNSERYKIWTEHGVLGVEMESTAIYTIAAANQVRALTVLTVSDNLLTGIAASSEEREKNIANECELVFQMLDSY